MSILKDSHPLNRSLFNVFIIKLFSIYSLYNMIKQFTEMDNIHINMYI